MSKERMRKHQHQCPLRPPQLSITTEITSLDDVTSLPPQMSPKKVSIMESPNHKWPKLTDMVKALDLVAKRDAARLSSRKQSTEVDCDILTDFEPMSPVQLKTPKSLISQLSFDETPSSRKRLTYSLSVEKDRDKMSVQDTETSEDEDAEAGTVGWKQQPASRLNLLNIPLTSLLGQRIKKSIRVDSPVTVLTDSTSFCRTPVKNNFLEKLRKKPLIYPVMYKPRKVANLHKQNHLYKFTKAQKKEFMSKANFGLSMNSYKLLMKMKPLRVHVQKLSRKALLRWMSRWRLEKQLRVKFKGLKSGCSADDGEWIYGKSEFPSGPSLLIQNIDKLLGLKRKSSQAKNSLSLSNFVSEEMEEEVSKQKLTLYRSLLYEMSVLKPTVVIDDIRGQHGVPDSQQMKKKRSEKSATLASNEEQSKPPKVDRSILRTMLFERKKERDQNQPAQHDYRTLRSILKSDEEKSKVEHKSISGCSARKNDAVAELRKSPPDDVYSILSLSSDSESLSSNCCPGCATKKGQPKTVLEPLNVKVDGPEMCLNVSNVYPSPLSICSESPSNVSPATLKFCSGDATTSTPDLSLSKSREKTTFKTPVSSPLSVNKTNVASQNGNTKVSVSIRTRSNSKTGNESQSFASTSSLVQAQSQTSVACSDVPRLTRVRSKRKREDDELNVSPVLKRARYSIESPVSSESSSNTPNSKPFKFHQSKSLPSSRNFPATRASQSKVSDQSDSVKASKGDTSPSTVRSLFKESTNLNRASDKSNSKVGTKTESSVSTVKSLYKDCKSKASMSPLRSLRSSPATLVSLKSGFSDGSPTKKSSLSPSKMSPSKGQPKQDNAKVHVEPIRVTRKALKRQGHCTRSKSLPYVCNSKISPVKFKTIS